MTYLANMLARDGYEVRTWRLAGTPDNAEPDHAAASDRVILPVPLAGNGLLNGTELPLCELWPRFRVRQRIYAGAVGRTERAAAEELGLRLTDYYQDEALTVQNAVPTAEGALAAAMERMSVTLHGAPCLVVGFGRIGRLLARDLAALGAEVSVSARRPESFAWIDALGYRGLHTERLSGRLGEFRAVFNTVPHMVLDAPLLRELRPDCVLIELASLSGIDREAAEAMGLSYCKAGGLPGKAAPETAASAILDTLYRIWEDEDL